MRVLPQVGAEFLARHYPVHTVLLPSPTWANHTKIFPLAGIADVRTYRYFRAASRDLDFQVGSALASSALICGHHAAATHSLSLTCCYACCVRTWPA